jgi:type IV secretion system protein VirD4
MRNSCNTWVYLSSNDPDTARVVSEKTGQATIATTSLSRSWGQGGGRNTTVSRTGRALLTADEVLRWPWGQALPRGGAGLGDYRKRAAVLPPSGGR